MKAEWKRIPFDAAIADESGGSLKTPQSEFLEEGKFAVVDQGKELIAGYINDPARVCRSPLPAIVFGDHTRCLKYVDFPFCMGADGIKVLRPKVDADVKYIFHYLRHIRLHDGGYDRHFKYLKRSDVILPPLAEQRRIAEVLDRAEALRAKRRAALAQLDSLTQSLFLDLFGDPASNPKRWPNPTLGAVLSFQQYGPRFYNESYSADGIRIVRITDLSESGSLDFSAMPRLEVSDEDREKYSLQPGDIIFARTGATVGKIALIQHDDPPCIAGAYFITMRFNGSLDPMYARAVLTSPSVRAIVVNGSRQAAQQNFSGPGLRRLPMPVPPLDLQHEFVRRVAAVERLKTAQRNALAELDALFAALQHRAFHGEL